LSGIEGVNLSLCLIARTELIDFRSDEGKCRFMNTPIRASEIAFHETHIGVQKWEPQFLTGFDVGSCHHPADGSKTDKPVKVGDGAWLRVDWITKWRGWPKNVIKTVKSRASTGDGNWGK
jgi:hypothetical protein